jgi:hypothetical protein
MACQVREFPNLLRDTVQHEATICIEGNWHDVYRITECINDISSIVCSLTSVTNKGGTTVMLYTHIQDVFGSKLDRDN